jgi:hypothetical protein
MISKALVAASTKPLLLSVLRNGESYGYQIIKRMKLLSGGRLVSKRTASSNPAGNRRKKGGSGNTTG